ncbi:hypothetical protein ACQP0C_24565 [Nocardia sp. CA-129566]|uniref:hypothetical protein n=1 Tax=Nocardia sp. CA-129566 TaxID=3239976 RepID=UPI003D95AD00
MVFPIVPAAIALYEWSKSGPPSSSSRDESADATQARNRIAEIQNAGLGLESQSSKVPESAYVNPDQLKSDLYERVSAMSVSDVKGLEQRWNALKNALDDGLKNFKPEILKAMDGKWNGAAAKSASDGIKEYVDKSAGLVGSVQLVAEKVKIVRSGIELTTANVHKAPGHTITSNIADWIPGPTWNINQHRDEQYLSAAENTIKNVFYPAVREADTGVPLVPKPYNPVYKSDDDTKKPGTDPSGKQPSTKTTNTPTNTPTNNPTSDPTTDPTSTNPTTTDTSSTNPTSTTPTTPTTTTDTPTVPTSTTPTGTSPSLSTGSGGTSTGTPTSTPSPGKTLNLPLVVTTSGTTATSNSSGSTGRSGMSGMGMPGSRGGGKDDEKESKSKEYLVNQQNGEELTGLDEAHRVKTVPPVIGA